MAAARQYLRRGSWTDRSSAISGTTSALLTIFHLQWIQSHVFLLSYKRASWCIYTLESHQFLSYLKTLMTCHPWSRYSSIIPTFHPFSLGLTRSCRGCTFRCTSDHRSFKHPVLFGFTAHFWQTTNKFFNGAACRTVQTFIGSIRRELGDTEAGCGVWRVAYYSLSNRMGKPIQRNQVYTRRRKALPVLNA